MKKHILIFLLLAMAFVACNKEKALPYYQPGEAVTLNSSTTSVVLSAANADQKVMVLSWTDPRLAVDTANYKFVVEIAPNGTHFAKPFSYTVNGGQYGIGVPGADLNNMLIAWGAGYGAATDLEIRVKSSYANNNDLKISNVLNVKVSAYAVPFTLNASAAGPLTPTVATKDHIFTVLSWNAPDYGSSKASYIIQYALAGTNFAAPKEIVIAADSVRRSLTGLEVYQMAANSGIALNTTGAVEMRVKAVVGGTGQVSYSSVQTLKISPVEMTLYMYIAGDFQGWDPAAAPKIASSDGVNYEGYAWVPAGGNGEFKMTSQADWNGTNYGGSSTATGGVLDPAGGSLKWPALGAYYRLKVNMNTKAWTITKTDWGLIGSATPGGWDKSTPMVYEVATGKWKATVLMTTGEFKFRANNSWDIDLGAAGTYLDYGKSNIPITAGLKTITLDLSNPLKYTYSIQ
ncbi:SusE domain-containing protein [Niabella drilacis]|uniref:SusE outer membrane protein n=1 Tax=Niabella drilacis (strain DSM 25811 / CCM 8410 / CCUG 62505 / LMG 26954 / E90) TaxID=1285928 RepID=A0A1G6Q0C5_NIADE|nr:SusE domain-containing protein [Niabella drilacis]SDC85374.1 SusE outer membrane protein [Niabella drilacis]